MKDLCEATGLERQAVHFYIQQGLLPAGHKTGRNMAWYSDEHVRRLRLIKKLQEERFLPLKAIKAILDGSEHSFTPAQERFLDELRDRMVPSQGVESVAQPAIDADDLIRETGATREDLDRAAELGLIGARRSDEGRLLIAERDRWMVELWAEMRRIGFRPELGFEVEDMTVYDEAITELFRRETQLLSSRLSHLPPDQVARMIEQALPLIHQFLVRHHTAQVQTFFEARLLRERARS